MINLFVLTPHPRFNPSEAIIDMSPVDLFSVALPLHLETRREFKGGGSAAATGGVVGGVGAREAPAGKGTTQTT